MLHEILISVLSRTTIRAFIYKATFQLLNSNLIADTLEDKEPFIIRSFRMNAISSDPSANQKNGNQ
jgi:hypothetical protein